MTRTLPTDLEQHGDFSKSLNRNGALRQIYDPFTTVITGATLVHPSKSGADALEPDATVVIQDERITYAGSGRAAKMPPGSTVIDGRGKFVIPGLVDSHVHFFQSGNLYTRPDVADFNAVVPYAQEVARNKARLDATFRVWLANGVTAGTMAPLEGSSAYTRTWSRPRSADTANLLLGSG